MKNYLKCVIRNRLTLGGIICLLLCPLPNFYLTQPASIALFSFLLTLGSFLLVITFFGAGTYRAYKKTKYHLQKYGAINEKLKSKLSYEYCPRVGMKLALKEANLDSNY